MKAAVSPLISQTTAEYHQWQLKSGASPNRCGPFSIAIAGNLMTKSFQFDGDTVAEEMKRNWLEWQPRKALLPRLNRFPPDSATMPGAIARYLTSHGVRAKLRVFGSLAALQETLSRGMCAIPIIGQWTTHAGFRWQPWGHALVVVGLAEERVIVLDPAQKTINPNDLHLYPSAVFLRYWSSMARIWIQVGDDQGRKREPSL